MRTRTTMTGTAMKLANAISDELSDKVRQSQPCAYTLLR